MCERNSQLEKLRCKLNLLGVSFDITSNGIIAWDEPNRKVWLFGISGNELKTYENATVMRKTRHGYVLVNIKKGYKVTLYSLKNEREITTIKKYTSVQGSYGLKSFDGEEDNRIASVLYRGDTAMFIDDNGIVVGTVHTGVSAHDKNFYENDNIDMDNMHKVGCFENRCYAAIHHVLTAFKRNKLEIVAKCIIFGNVSASGWGHGKEIHKSIYCLSSDKMINGELDMACLISDGESIFSEDSKMVMCKYNYENDEVRVKYPALIDVRRRTKIYDSFLGHCIVSYNLWNMKPILGLHIGALSRFFNICHANVTGAEIRHIGRGYFVVNDACDLIGHAVQLIYNSNDNKVIALHNADVQKLHDINTLNKTKVYIKNVNVYENPCLTVRGGDLEEDFSLEVSILSVNGRGFDENIKIDTFDQSMFQWEPESLRECYLFFEGDRMVVLNSAGEEIDPWVVYR